MNDKQLSIRLNGKPVGILEQDVSGKLWFQYLPEAEQILSLSLPLQNEPYTNELTEAYFGGLLPEGEPARMMLAKRFGISAKNTFSMLRAIGYDCAGSVSCHVIDDPVIETDKLPLRGQVLSEKELATHIRELPKRPLFIGVEGIRLSLAGAQDKAAICLIGNQPSIPTDGSPTSHILKPPIDRIEGSVPNEYLCLKLAKRMGLSVPNVEIRDADGIPYLLVERYDREILSNKTIRRVHQEDFCQALGILSTHKYQSEGGPGFKECFELLKRTSQPAKDRTQLAEAMIFNFLVGNNDAHGKNFSLLYLQHNQIVMSPLYDLLCTQAYPELTSKMAMKIGGKNDANDVFLRHWQRLCEDVAFSFPVLKKMIFRYVEQLSIAFQEERVLLKETNYDHPIADKIQAVIEKNCDKTAKRMQQAST